MKKSCAGVGQVNIKESYVDKKEMIKKLKRCFWCAIVCLPLFFIWSAMDYKIDKPLLDTMDIKTMVRPTQNRMKYILVWTDPNVEPIVYLREARLTFIKRNCPVSNCYVTSNRLFFDNITEFDVIVFHGKEIARRLPTMPHTRSTHQKYVYANMESSHYYPIRDVRFNGYFNWTWTYKLDSDVHYGYISIKDNRGNIIGPKKDIQWMHVEDMDPINETIKEKLMNKRKIAAWFVSNCNTPSEREKYVDEIQKELEYYGLSVDVYGKCGTKKCPRDEMIDCLKMIETDYYFYFSFENSFSEDYVTEKLLHSLDNYAVPVVFGGADYSRFMPDGIYLDGKKLGAKELVNRMIEIMTDKAKYYNFFKWHNHYSYHMVGESPDTDSYCRLCAKINDKSINNISIYGDFRKWWNPPGIC